VHDPTGYLVSFTGSSNPAGGAPNHLTSLTFPTAAGVYTLNAYPNDFGSLASYVNYRGVNIQGRTNGTISTDTFDLDLNITCGGGCGSLAAPCCPPDPVLMGLVARLVNAVDLIQRQSVPFGYVPGTVHAGLTGSNVLAVQGLIGAKVDVTTLPAHFGVAAGTPAEHFDLGWLTWGTADGYPQSERIEHNPQLSLPARAGAFTDLAYNLAAGVVATITELKREP
jgi:hypothetical protein